MTPDPQLTHVRLLVDDYAACFAFYADRLGFEPTFGDAESGYADFDTGDVSLALFAADEMATAVPDGDTERGRDVACLVLGVESVDDAVAAYRAEGVTFVTDPTDRPEWGIRTAHCRDPDGTLLELTEPLEA